MFISETYELGSALVRFTGTGFEEVWTDRDRRRNQAMALHWNTPIEHDGYLYGSSGYHAPEAELRCVEWKTGKVMWSEPDMGRSSLLFVDGTLVCLSEDGTLRLVRATPERYEELAKWELKSGGRHAAAHLSSLGRPGPLERITVYPRRRPLAMSEIDRQPITSAAAARNGDALFSRATLLVGAAMILIYAVVLQFSGQPGWCKYGFAIWANAWTNCTSQQVLDPYSFSHVLHGILLFWMLWPLAGKISLRWRAIVALGIEIGWELLENSPWVIERYRQVTASLDYSGDSVINSFFDVVLAVVGFAIAARFSWKVSVALFIVLELAALLIARDNLTLNVIMLFRPIDAIREWQLAR